MDIKAVDRVYRDVLDIIKDEQYGTVMMVLGMLHNEYAVAGNPNEKALRGLYSSMADSALFLVTLNDSNELQAEEDSTQKEEGAEERQAPRNERGSSKPN